MAFGKKDPGVGRREGCVGGGTYSLIWASSMCRPKMYAFLAILAIIRVLILAF